jgi:purine-binding chemotaxis protein CheW
MMDVENLKPGDGIIHMKDTMQILIFFLDNKPFGIPVETVIHVHPAVIPEHVPSAPDTVPGLINVHGTVMPLVDMRKKCGLAVKPIALEDRIIEIMARETHLALLVDLVEGISEYPKQDFLNPQELIPGVTLVDGIVKHEKGLALVYNIERFFSPEYSFAYPAKEISSIRHIS